MVPVSIKYSNLENVFFMKVSPMIRLRKYAVQIFCCLFILLVVFNGHALAQQKAFAVNSHDNPLKSFTLLSNKESHPFFVDIDGDGDLDCFSGEYSNAHLAKIYFYRNDGNNRDPQFKQVTGDANALNKVAANVLSIPYFIDIDGDGDYDCFIGEGNTGALMYYKNTGTATHAIFQKQSAAFNPLSMVKFAVSGIANPSFADVDADGDYDCLVVDEDGNESYFKNNGTPRAPSFVHIAASDDPFRNLVINKGAYSPSFYDWNKDGLPDLFINTTYYKNVGTVGNPAFAVSSDNQPFFQNKSADQYSYTPLRWVDINNDGAIDVFQGTSKGTFVFQTLSSDNSEAIAATTPVVRVFPNPSKEEFMITVPGANARSVIRVTDVQGKLLSTFVTNNGTVKFGKELKAGTYIVQVMQNNKSVYTQKIIKE